MFRQRNEPFFHGVGMHVGHFLVVHGSVGDLDRVVRLLPEHELLVLVRALSRFPQQPHQPFTAAFARLIGDQFQQSLGREALEVPEDI